MNVTFTRKEFTRLVELAYMGKHMATALNDTAKNPYVKRYGDLMKKLYFLAANEKDGCPDYVAVSDGSDEDYEASVKLESDSPAANAVDQFTNDTFWDELITRMAERDYDRETLREPLPREIDPNEILERQIKREQQLEDRYRDEFVKNDLGNVFVMVGADRLS